MNRKQRTILIAAILFAFSFVFLGTTYVLLQSAEETEKISTEQDQGTARAGDRDQTLREIKKVAEQIRSCTTPGEPCSERNRKATAKAVSDIGRANAAAAAAASACALQVERPTFQRIYNCVLDTLEDAARDQ